MTAIEEFIGANPSLAESAAFDRFLQQERVRAWVGTDASRRDRLRREFARVWAEIHAARPAKVTVEPERRLPGRKLQLLCPACGALDVWSEGGAIVCRACGTGYPDMLKLVPVKPVGPFAYYFGEGAAGWLAAGALALLLLAIYGVVKWG